MPMDAASTTRPRLPHHLAFVNDTGSKLHIPNGNLPENPKDPVF